MQTSKNIITDIETLRIKNNLFEQNIDKLDKLTRDVQSQNLHTTFSISGDSDFNFDVTDAESLTVDTDSIYFSVYPSVSQKMEAELRRYQQLLDRFSDIMNRLSYIEPIDIEDQD